MAGPVYPRVLGEHGIEAVVPDEDDRRQVDRVIFDELVQGVVTEPSRQAFVGVVERLQARGCDAVALVCTEVPLLVTPEVSPLPTLDSTRLGALAALRVCLGDDPLPAWRGGPLDPDR